MVEATNVLNHDATFTLASKNSIKQPLPVKSLFKRVYMRISGFCVQNIMFKHQYASFFPSVFRRYAQTMRQLNLGSKLNLFNFDVGVVSFPKHGSDNCLEIILSRMPVERLPECSSHVRYVRNVQHMEKKNGWVFIFFPRLKLQLWCKIIMIKLISESLFCFILSHISMCAAHNPAVRDHTEQIESLKGLNENRTEAKSQ